MTKPIKAIELEQAIKLTRSIGMLRDDFRKARDAVCTYAVQAEQRIALLEQDKDALKSKLVNELARAVLAGCAARVTAELLYRADCFDYLCWLEEKERRERVPEADFLCCASDGTTCWGKRYADAVKVAMNHDKGIQDASEEKRHNAQALPRGGAVRRGR